MQTEKQDPTQIAVALSGGGHRACLFALGALLYLVDAGVNGSLTSAASVSGGSLANGAIAQSLDLTQAKTRDFEAVAARVSGKITGRGTLFGSWLTHAYLALLALTAVAALLLTFAAPLAGWLRVLVFVAGLILIGWLASLRGRVCAAAFERTLFRGPDRSPRLDAIHDGLDHVFCATDLHAGEHVYFSGGFVYSYRFGLGIPGGVRLSTVVQASAAFPGAFPVAWLPTRRHRFEGGAQEEAARTRRMALVDGGVYDNMGDQWAQGMLSRRKRVGASASRFRSANEMIVVNASAGLDWGSLRGFRIPLLSELLALLRDKSVLYDNGNSLRRQALFRLFTQAQRGGPGTPGALVHIPQSPFRIADAFAHGDDSRANRARSALHRLIGNNDADAVRAIWAEIAKANAAVPTTLRRLDVDTASRLLRHSYVLAMVNLHVILGHPLLDRPDPARFNALAEGSLPFRGNDPNGAEEGAR